VPMLYIKTGFITKIVKLVFQEKVRESGKPLWIIV